MLQKIKTITSYTGHARFCAECDDYSVGYIPRQRDIPSPYRYSPAWSVMNWRGRAVVWVEVSHRRYVVFAVPREMIMASKEAATAIGVAQA